MSQDISLSSIANSTLVDRCDGLMLLDSELSKIK